VAERNWRLFAVLGGKKVDLIFSDTCLNGMIEVLEQFKEFAEVVVGSEDLEPGGGWEYHEWFGLMSDSPLPMQSSGADKPSKASKPATEIDQINFRARWLRFGPITN
jgi:hypothetical protein